MKLLEPTPNVYSADDASDRTEEQKLTAHESNANKKPDRQECAKPNLCYRAARTTNSQKLNLTVLDSNNVYVLSSGMLPINL